MELHTAGSGRDGAACILLKPSKSTSLLPGFRPVKHKNASVAVDTLRLRITAAGKAAEVSPHSIGKHFVLICTQSQASDH